MKECYALARPSTVIISSTDRVCLLGIIQEDADGPVPDARPCGVLADQPGMAEQPVLDRASRIDGPKGGAVDDVPDPPRGLEALKEGPGVQGFSDDRLPQIGIATRHVELNNRRGGRDDPILVLLELPDQCDGLAPARAIPGLMGEIQVILSELGAEDDQRQSPADEALGPVEAGRDGADRTGRKAQHHR